MPSMDLSKSNILKDSFNSVQSVMTECPWNFYFFYHRYRVTKTNNADLKLRTK